MIINLINGTVPGKMRYQPSFSSGDVFSHLTSGFFFMSPFRTLATEGCFQAIPTPALDGADLQGRLQTSIESAFAEARAAGIEHPLVTGAIPFDPAQDSALFVPRVSRWLSADQVRRQALALENQPTPPRQILPLPEREEFLSMVEGAIEAMDRGQLEKVVLSRLLHIDTEESVETGALLARLIQQNSSGYQFHCPLPGGHRLLGSSPELLLRKQGAGFASQPLAGTARRDLEDAAQDQQIALDLLDSSKDRHEHQLVVSAIKQKLAAHCRTLQVPDAPECVNTSALWHLATTISGESNRTGESALSLACLLHPTPALSGFPHQQAQRLLTSLEPFNRDFFGGIVGWCDDRGDGEWAIAIRCAEIAERRVRLFAGAGIVPASVPAAEWQETGAKLTTMLRAFGIV